MRTAVDNPFMPGSDSVPMVWAGRLDQMNEWRLVIRPRRAAGIPERGRTILGEAGVGKSTLVRRIARQAEKDGDWVTPQIRIPSGTDPLKAVAKAILTLADRASLAAATGRKIQDVLDRVRAVAAAGISLTVDRREGPEPYSALTELLVEVGVAAARQNVAVLVHIDEVQNIASEDVLSQLLVCLGDAIAYEHVTQAPGGQEITSVLPIAVYLTGLPEFADMAGAKKGATFARRFATTHLEPIDDNDLRLALRPFVTPGWSVAQGTSVVQMTEAAVEEIIRLCCGEPFLFQLAGERAWYAGTDPVIGIEDVRKGWSQVHREATTHIERILARLPDRERQMLDAMAGLPPAGRSATAIAHAMGFTSATQAGPTAQRLDTVRGIVNRGAPYSFRHRAVEAYLTSEWPKI